MKDAKPLVSIAVPCFNHEKYVKSCIDSIISQKYQNIELIIIDDGSSDESADAISDLATDCKNRFSRFQFISRKNRGLCVTLNEAIGWCEGFFYSAIASDDMMLPNKTSIQVDFFTRNSQYDASFGAMLLIDENGEPLRKLSPASGPITFEDLLLVKRSPAAPTQMIRMETLRKFTPYPPGLYIDDWYMWLKITNAGHRIMSLPDELVLYRRHQTNISSNLEKMASARQDILKEYESHPFYRRAQAASLLSQAVEIQKKSRTVSFRHALAAVRTHPATVLDKRFFLYALKMLVPQGNRSDFQ